MSRRIWIFMFILILFQFSLAEKEFVIQKGIDFSKKLDRNNVFLKGVFSFDFYNDHIYFPERYYGKISKIDLKTGKLLKTISSKGEGPGELRDPVCIKVKHDKIFVYDSRFGGIKIFDQDGNLINEFKTPGVYGWRTFDVNQKEEIFIGAPDFQNQTFVKVYNIQGDLTESLVFFKSLNEVENSKKSKYYYYLKLDNEGNILLLFYLIRRIAKYNRKGELLWQSEIKNKILDKYEGEESVRRGEKTISISQVIFHFDITEDNNIIVGHVRGGSLFSKNGKFRGVIKFTEPGSLFLFKVRNNKLINIIFWGTKIDIYDFRF